MKYMMILTHDPAVDPAVQTAPPEDVITDWVEMTQALRDAGILRGGDGLQGAETATTVRRRDGERLVTDGPFAETTELLIGYYVIEVDDLDTALAWAARMPNSTWGSVEVRPLLEGSAAA